MGNGKWKTADGLSQQASSFEFRISSFEFPASSFQFLNSSFRLSRAVWSYLREACGENDYARHCARAQAEGTPAMTAERFYLWQLGRKYSRISRCC
jgi:hypothetical protein